MKRLKILMLALVVLAVGLSVFADPINVGGTSFTTESSPINVGGTSFTASSPINVGGTAFTTSSPINVGGTNFTADKKDKPVKVKGGKGGKKDKATTESLLSPINVGGT